MRRLKRVVAVTLATTMVLGGSFTTFAAGETSGETEGIGTSEGHVDKKKTNVVLPTIASGSPSPFAYTMDPEGLVSGTDHAKYENAEFPTTNDTGVYFNNGKKGGNDTDKDNIVYKNESSALEAINKSSHGIELTVKAEAVNGAADVPLVAKDALTTATDASLYLGLIVNSENAVAVTKDAAATKTVTINGTEGNFKIAVNADKNGYEYRELTLAEYQALDGNSSKTQDDLDATWAKASFKLEGATTTNKAITSATTAPTVKVTWSWTDPTANSAPSIATRAYTLPATAAALDIPVSLGAGTLKATAVADVQWKEGSNFSMLPGIDGFKAVYADGKVTLDTATVQAFKDDAGASATLVIVFDDTAETKIEVTLNK